MKNNLPFLKHIRDETIFLMDKTKGLTFERFSEDEVLKRAVTRSIEIIGEAVKNISAEFRRTHSDIEWKGISGMRDKIIHFYFGVKWNTVWSVIKNEIPELKPKVEAIIKQMEDKL